MTDTRALAEMIARVGLVADSDHGEMRNGVWVNRQHDAIAAAIQHLVSTAKEREAMSSNTDWAREAEEIVEAIVSRWPDDPIGALAWAERYLLAVERKAKEECAQIAEDADGRLARSTTSAVPRLQSVIAAAIRSTLPPTSKAE